MRNETYTPGHDEQTIAYMARRTAQSHAAFFLLFLEPGQRLLDCACGPGSITAGLAAAVAPGPVTGVDLHPEQFENGRRLAEERGLTNVEFREADAYALPFGDGSFDRVFSNALLEHLARPVEALRELRRVLVPGGIAGFSVPDWGGFVYAPPDAGAERAGELYQAVQRANGGDGHVGRKLGELLAAAGFSDIEMSARYETNDRTYVAGYIARRLESMAEMAETGVASPRELREAAAGIRAWAEHPQGLFAGTWVQAVAKA